MTVEYNYILIFLDPLLCIQPLHAEEISIKFVIKNLYMNVVTSKFLSRRNENSCYCSHV
jgi:hypothetical protein